MSTLKTAILRDWIARCFGSESADDRIERARRFLEEALELAQAAGISQSFVISLSSDIYSRAPGLLEQEIGGVMLCLRALCAASKLDADFLEELELRRILHLEPSHFRERQTMKARAGLGKKPSQ